MRVFLDLMWYFKTRKKYYIGGIALLIVVSCLGLIPPRLVGDIIDSANNHTLTAHQLVDDLLLIGLLALGMYASRYYWRLLLFGRAIELSALLRFKLFQHFTRMSPQFYHQNRIGDLMAHATNDISAIESTALDGILTLVDSITSGTLVILTMAITISWKLTLVALLPMPIIAFTTSKYGNILHRRFIKAQASFSDINDKVQENISGVRVIKSFGQEEIEIHAFAQLSEDVVKKNIAVAKIDALFNPTISVLVGLSYILSFSIGTYFIVHGRMTFGELTTFSIYLGQLIWPMLAFGWLFNIVERGRASYHRVNTLLAVPEDIVDKPGAGGQPPTGDICFDLTSFTHPGQTQPTLYNIHFRLGKGQTLGIVGRTGSGKTTLIKLLLREFDVADGRISIGESAIVDVTLDALRQTIGYVPQEHFLFSADIAQNIAFGRPASKIEEIVQAAKTACIHEDIQGFEAQYATVVGERGVTLSGGQKQRLSIARALLLNSEILILDDALSAVDARTETSILAALRQDRFDRTTLIATHRMSAIEHADLILVLDEGTIVERGTHRTLMAAGGLYQSMVERQQLESLVAEGGTAS